MNYDCIKTLLDNINNHINEYRMDSDYKDDSDNKLIRLYFKINKLKI